MRKQPAAPAVPLDVRLMNITAALVFTLALLGIVGAAGWWALRHPAFSLVHITVEGDVAHSSVATLRANVASQLQGNFFTLDLVRTRKLFEDIPWVRKAVVRREFPNRVRVILQEHEAVALWGADGDTTLVNSHGEVFEANAGDIEHESLPRLAGPPGQSAQVLATWRALAPMFDDTDLVLEQLTLTGRGSWQAVLDSGARLELGRGTTDEVAARTHRFVRTLTQATGRYGRRPEALVSADLRHADGYALRLRGVTTVAGDAPPKK